jgi:predicted nucleic acid-binding protein
LTVVADTNVLVELFLPAVHGEAVQLWRLADGDWRLPSLWICEFRHIHLKYLRAGLLEPGDALNNLRAAEQLFLATTTTIDSAEALQLAHRHGCSSYDAEFVLLAQQLSCPLLTFDRQLLELFPDIALKPSA